MDWTFLSICSIIRIGLEDKNISSIKKATVWTRKIVKILIIAIVAAAVILGLIQLIYRQTYSVSLNGELIGYTNDKVALQKRINDYISSGDGGDVAFVELNELPTYEACMLKKDVQANDEEIFEKVKASGTPYYKYYVITAKDVEKANVKTFQDAEQVIEKLKEKDSVNKDSLSIVEKYTTSKLVSADESSDEENVIKISSVDSSVNSIYEKRVVYTSYSRISRTIYNESSVPTDIGVSLVTPLTGRYQLSSVYGWRSLDNHPGIDLAASAGTAIKAAAGGKVIAAGYTRGYSGYGNVVVVQSTPSVIILYGHCSMVHVTVGEQVAQGQVIAKVGNTGYSFGNHLHFEIRYNGKTVDPQNYIYKGVRKNTWLG